MGGQGTTWIATPNSAPGTRVAIKVLRYSARGFPKQYWSELEALVELRLPCLPRIVDSGISEGHPWIATELVEGTDLVQYEAGATVGALVEIVARAAEGLACLHRAGYVHRDIKPSNLMVRASDGAVLIVDLGVSCRIGAPLAGEAIIGTPEFMSPEQAGNAPPSAASDQWSLAATAFLMLTGETPHAVARTVGEQLERARSGTPRPARGVAPTLDAPIAAVLDRALSRDARRRFRDCDELALHLRNAANGRMPPRGRHPRTAILTSALVAVLSAIALMLRPPAPPETWKLADGDYPEGRFGEAIVVLGDLDGDGLDEIAVSSSATPSRSAHPWRTLAGEVFVFNGRALAGTSKAEPHILSGSRAFGRFGRCLSAVGDVDGDGVPDLSGGLLDPEGRCDALIVVKGSPHFARPGRTDLAAHPTVTHPVEVGFGPYSSHAGCDLDGDGCNDVIAGEPFRGPDRAGGLVVLKGARGFFTTRGAPQRFDPPPGVRSFGGTVAIARAQDGSAPLLLVGAALGSPDSGDRGRIVVMRRDLSVVGSIVGARDHEWFGYAIDGRIVSDNLRIACGALGIARIRDDSGRAYLAEIPLEALEGRSAPIDLDATESSKWIRSRITGKAVDKGGTGELCGQAVALLPEGWIVASPRAETEQPFAGRVWIEDARQRIAIDGRSRLEEAGLGIAVWTGADRTLVLIGAPLAGENGMRSSGVVRVLEPKHMETPAKAP